MVLLGSKIVVACARVGGVNATPLFFSVFSAAHFAKRNMKFGGGGKRGRAKIPSPQPPSFLPARASRILFKKSSRGAHGGSKLNCTLHESPATASQSLGGHQRKMFLAFRICAGWIFSKNGKDIFLFGVLPSKYSGSVAGRNAYEAKQNYFAGGKGFCFASAFLCGDLVSAAQEGAGGMRGGFLMQGLVSSEELCYGSAGEKSIVGFSKQYIHNHKDGGKEDE